MAKQNFILKHTHRPSYMPLVEPSTIDSEYPFQVSLWWNTGTSFQRAGEHSLSVLIIKFRRYRRTIPSHLEDISSRYFDQHKNIVFIFQDRADALSFRAKLEDEAINHAPAGEEF